MKIQQIKVRDEAILGTLENISISDDGKYMIMVAGYSSQNINLYILEQKVVKSTTEGEEDIIEEEYVLSSNKPQFEEFDGIGALQIRWAKVSPDGKKMVAIYTRGYYSDGNASVLYTEECLTIYSISEEGVFRRGNTIVMDRSYTLRNIEFHPNSNYVLSSGKGIALCRIGVNELTLIEKLPPPVNSNYKGVFSSCGSYVVTIKKANKTIIDTYNFGEGLGSKVTSHEIEHDINLGSVSEDANLVLPSFAPSQMYVKDGVTEGKYSPTRISMMQASCFSPVKNTVAIITDKKFALKTYSRYGAMRDRWFPEPNPPTGNVKNVYVSRNGGYIAILHERNKPLITVYRTGDGDYIKPKPIEAIEVEILNEVVRCSEPYIYFKVPYIDNLPEEDDDSRVIMRISSYHGDELCSQYDTYNYKYPYQFERRNPNGHQSRFDSKYDVDSFFGDNKVRQLRGALFRARIPVKPTTECTIKIDVKVIRKGD